MTRKEEEEEEGCAPPATLSLFNLRETFSRLELSHSEEEEEEEEEEEQELRALFSSAHDEESSRLHSSDDVLVFLETKTKRKDFDESKGLVDDEDDDDDESSLPSCAICLTEPALENSCFTVPCLHSLLRQVHRSVGLTFKRRRKTSRGKNAGCRRRIISTIVTAAVVARALPRSVRPVECRLRICCAIESWTGPCISFSRESWIYGNIRCVC